MLRDLVRVAAVAALSSACADTAEPGPACLALGLDDSATIHLTTEDNTWPEGAYAVELAIDGAEPHLCEFDFPADLSASPFERPLCRVTDSARLEFAPNCLPAEHGLGATLAEDCEPVPDEWIGTLIVGGTPEQLDVRVARDGLELLQDVVYPSYLPEESNGTGCGFAFTSTTKLRIPTSHDDL